MSRAKTTTAHPHQRPAFTPWVHPEKLFSIDIPSHWQSHRQSDDFLSLTLYFHPPEDPDVRL
ncbi:MAG: hypothetical protein ACKO2P_03350, partial [Planctomycetota bacterium]